MTDRWREFRQPITRDVAIAARAMARAGRTPREIAQATGLTEHVARLFVEAPVNDQKPQPHFAKETKYGHGHHELPWLADNETSVPPRRCSVCLGLIDIIPCRACRLRRETTR